MGISNINHSKTEPVLKISSDTEDLTRRDADRIEAQANTNAVSRTITIVILMLLLGVAGSYLDQWLNTQFFVVIGFVLGMGIAIFGLLYVALISDLAAKKSRDLRSRDSGKSIETESQSNYE